MSFYQVFVVLFFISAIISFFKKNTWYRKVARYFSIISSLCILLIFGWFILNRSESKCIQNTAWFYNDNGTLCYLDENYGSLYDKHNKRTTYVTKFNILTPQRAVAYLDDGRVVVIYDMYNQRLFEAYEGE
ncbi:hypothetical protein [Providencia hangzhouensis]|uniref:hypothetical protein n=1 Tax=Providencia hangzhouensis TaxID=3031799 RepID=UPI0034DDC30A